MAAKTPRVMHVRLPRQRLRKTAAYLLESRNWSIQSASTRTDTPTASIKVICISDTHNLRPVLPSGDLLIHAGDLTEWGTFDEVQAQLTWLSSQPHKHKVIIAGNHDLLFDEAFLEKHPEHRDPQNRTRRDLEFGSLMYLEDESLQLSFTDIDRTLNIYGCPWTPQYGTSAFQYPREQDIWAHRIPDSTDILITHGPPSHFNSIKPSAGCPYLRQEVARVRPRLMVFGHIHIARGEQTVVFDKAQELYDDLVDGARGWEAVPILALAIAWSAIRRTVLRRLVKSTRMIDAAVVDGMKKDVALEAFVVEV